MGGAGSERQRREERRIGAGSTGKGARGRSFGAHRGSVDWAGLLDLGDGAVLFITLGDE
jgi:hypothetical protein